MHVLGLIWCVGLFFLRTGNAMPLLLPTTTSGDRYDILIGAMAFIGVGAAMGACVCCRRRKRSFELEQLQDRKEFENEPEVPARTEYPIFRALSPTQNNEDGGDTDVPENSAIVNMVGYQNRMADVAYMNEEIDNNNGPISSADLENIENNNAIGFIPNRNEIGVIVEQPLLSINRNLILNHFDHIDERSIMNLTNSESDHRSDTNPFLSNDVVVNVENVPNLQQTKDHQRSELEQNESLISSDGGQEPINFIKIENLLCNESNVRMSDNTSVASTNSISEYDPNDYHVEEALRELDFAISGNDIDDDAIEDDCLHDTLTEILNSTCNKYLSSRSDFIECAGEPIEEVSEICVRAEAKVFVDSLLDECIDILSTKRSEITPSPTNVHQQYDIYFLNNDTNSVENSLNETVVDLTKTHTQDGKPNELIEPINNVDCRKSRDSLEHDFFDEFAIETSTPCVQKKFQKFNDHESNPSHKQLFRDMNETFDKTMSKDLIIADRFIGDKTMTLPDNSSKEINTVEINNETFVNDKTITMSDKQINGENMLNATFNCIDKSPDDVVPKPSMNCPKIKIDKDDVLSEDLTTVTPLNTPIELNYSIDSWDRFISNSMNQTFPVVPPTKPFDSNEPCTSEQATKRESSGWFLHPQQQPQQHQPVHIEPMNQTYEMEADNEDDSDEYEYDYDDDDDNDDDGENDEGERYSMKRLDLNSTFDALRKQLAEALPHAQGVTAPPDINEDDDAEKWPVNEGIEPITEMVINYRVPRPLSPIMEESEDETCKTFIMNDTKGLDSTSTGCAGTGEAIMGVSKTLMASNDTLFNFEDTLDENQDFLSPRAPSTDGSKSIQATDPTSDINATFDAVKSVDKLQLKLNDLDVNNQNDLPSPEQQKTISDDVLSIEQSSDLSGTAADGTFTMCTVEERTCIAAKQDDERISEISEPDWGSNTSYNINEMNSLIDVPSLNTVKELFESENCQSITENDCKSQMGKQDTTVEKLDETVDVKEQTLGFLANEINFSSSQICNQLNKLNWKENIDPNLDYSSKNDQDNSQIEQKPIKSDFLDIPDIIKNEKDFINTINDIHFTGPGTDLSSQYTQDWDSDVDDSNSSEEFMYVKVNGSEHKGVAPDMDSPELYRQKLKNKQLQEDKGSSTDSDDNRLSNEELTEENEMTVWNSHEDKVPVADGYDRKQSCENSDGSDVEEEWVPSCWNSSAQPARSALKSPDKSSSEEDTSAVKKRRSVAFKKQKYHSVYEYPREVVTISPAYSEPQMWHRDDTNRPFSHILNDSTNGKLNDFNELGGFTISGTARPFHSSQFHAQCHTWPTDSDFSWSQFDSEIESQNKFPNYSNIQNEWPKNGDSDTNESTNNGRSSETESSRPDSGVGESAELLSESISLGGLRHTKDSLRLPLKSVPAFRESTDNYKPLTIDTSNSQPTIESFHFNKHHLPPPTDVDLLTDVFHIKNQNATPSGSGSMDSLSSSSDSDRQISFVTFGKRPPSLDLTNGTPERSELILTDVRDEKLHKYYQPNVISTNKLCVNESSSRRHNDSTDEDSGIESIMRLAKEIV